jgi:hypothetical protein
VNVCLFNDLVFPYSRLQRGGGTDIVRAQGRRAPTPVIHLPEKCCSISHSDEHKFIRVRLRSSAVRLIFRKNK